MTDSIYDVEVEDIRGEAYTLERYRGKTLLVVNTASRCGYTPQYKGLERLHKTYADQGLVVLGFPCNQFGKQEPGSNDEIDSFCQGKFGVTFPMHGKVEVNGSNTHSLFRILKKSATGILGTQAIKWNFTKFLVDSTGKIFKRFAPNTTPRDIEEHIKALLSD